MKNKRTQLVELSRVRKLPVSGTKDKICDRLLAM